MKIKKLLSLLSAAAMTLTALTGAMSASVISASAAAIGGTITITAGGLSSNNKTAEVSINEAGSYSATIEFSSTLMSIGEIGFFTYSPYPVEDDLPFTVVVDSVTMSGTINGSGDTHQWTFNNFLDTDYLVPASEHTYTTGKNIAALPRKGQFSNDTIIANADLDGNGTKYYIIVDTSGFMIADGDSWDSIENVADISTIKYNFTIKEGAAKADFSKLQEAVEKAKTYKEKEKTYKPETYKPLAEALAEGEKLLANDEAKQKAVNAAVEAINSAISGLVEKNASLKQTIETTKSTYVNESNKFKYTTTSYNALTDAIASGEAIAENPESTQEQIDAAEQDINNAVAGLKERADSDHNSQLNKAQNQYRNVTGTAYTEESYKKFRELVDKLLEMTQENSSNEDIEQMISEVKSAYEALEIAPLDFTEIAKALTKGWEITENPEYSNYCTEESFAELLEAVKTGEELYEKAIKESGNGFDPNQATVNHIDLAIAAANIIYYIEHLEYNPADFAKVDEALKKVPEDLSVYTDETVKALNNAINAVDRTKNIMEQETVDGYVKPIEDAIAALAYKPADYTAVDEAIAKVMANLGGLSKYTEASVKALNEAINAVDRTKNITEQETVDGYAKAIEDAIAGLTINQPAPTKPSNPSTAINEPTVPSAQITTASTKSQAQKKAEKVMKQAKITKLTVKSKAKNKITVTWKKVSNAKGYEVEVSAKKNFKKAIVSKTTTKKKLTIKNKKLKSKKTYYVRVRAYATYKAANGKAVKVYSDWNKKVGKIKVK